MRQTSFKLFPSLFVAQIESLRQFFHYIADFLITSGTLLHLDALPSIGA